MVPEIYSLSYEEGLYECGILSLEMRRLRSDLILVFEIVKGFVKVEADKFFLFLENPIWKIRVQTDLQAEHSKVYLLSESDHGVEPSTTGSSNS